MFNPSSVALAGGIALALLPIGLLHIREGRWYRRQRRRMELDRLPLGDAEFLRRVASEPGDEPLWLAVRRAMADSLGLPFESLDPHDRLADLWRMQWLGPDLLDIVFRLERSLGIKVPRMVFDKYSGVIRYGQAGEFHEFAAAVVSGLREATIRRAPEA